MFYFLKHNRILRNTQNLNKKILLLTIFTCKILKVHERDKRF